VRNFYRKLGFLASNYAKSLVFTAEELDRIAYSDDVAEVIYWHQDCRPEHEFARRYSAEKIYKAFIKAGVQEDLARKEAEKRGSDYYTD